MSKPLTEFRVFIASPGGLESERELFRDTLQEYNEIELHSRGLIFTPIGWEITLGGFGRPQHLINADLVRCDYFILLLWDRWGSPPDKQAKDKYSSGCEEEFALALECLADPERPMTQVVVFFKGVEKQQLKDPGPQLEKVLEFRRQLEESKKHLFMNFEDGVGLKKHLRRFLAQWTLDHEERPDEHEQILEKGVANWNAWRKRNPTIVPDLFAANLKGAYLSKIDLSKANLARADLSDADLIEADLRNANLTEALVVRTNLFGADLTNANLRGAVITNAHLKNTKLHRAILGDTVMTKIDLSSALGIEEITHSGSSSIGVDTIYASKGDIPESFLRNAGVPTDFITYMKSLVGNAIEFYSCFISYSSKDQVFAERLHADLQGKGVRCWFATEDIKIGDKFRSRIEDSIRLYDKLLVVVSENSIRSLWVQEEVEAGLYGEHQHPGSTVLFPIRLDEAIMETQEAWAASLRRTRHIGDFRDWKNHDKYKKAFDRLLRDLKARNEGHAAAASR
jgi:uncharacterized protein YjbI with pentapeptide repeats